MIKDVWKYFLGRKNREGFFKGQKNKTGEIQRSRNIKN